MISKNQIKFIRSLEKKKFRREHNLFIAEGIKIVNEILNSSLKIHSLYHLKNFQVPILKPQFPSIEIEEQELEKISFLSSPNEVLCLVEIPECEINFKEISERISIYLDDVKDPGNLGNIIRIADWFAIENILCSSECVDTYNLKAVQATMGSIARVKIHESANSETIRKLLNTNSEFQVYATVINGNSIYKEKLSENGLIIFGNESEGISKDILALANRKISIPGFGKAESLNVAASAAIVCSEFKRKIS